MNQTLYKKKGHFKNLKTANLNFSYTILIQILNIIIDVIELKTTTKPWTLVKFMFSEEATKIDKIFTVDLTSCSKCQIDSYDFVNFCGLLRKHELDLRV